MVLGLSSVYLRTVIFVRYNIYSFLIEVDLSILVAITITNERQ